MLLRAEAETLHQIIVSSQAEIVILSFADDHTQGAVNDSYLHQCPGELRYFFLHQLSLQVNTGGCNGDWVLHELICYIHLGNQECRNQVAHSFAGSHTRFIHGNLLFAQAFQHCLCHLDLFFSDRKTKLRHNAAEQDFYQVTSIDFPTELDAPGMAQFISHRIDHERNQQGVVLIAEHRLAFEDLVLDMRNLVIHLILDKDVVLAVEHHIAIHDGEIIVIGDALLNHQGQLTELSRIFLSNLKHSNSPLSIYLSCPLRSSILLKTPRIASCR